MRKIGAKNRSGMAAIEVVLTTALTFVIFSFLMYFVIQMTRVIFSLIGGMTGSPLM